MAGQNLNCAFVFICIKCIYFLPEFDNKLDELGKRTTYQDDYYDNGVITDHKS